MLQQHCNSFIPIRIKKRKKERTRLKSKLANYKVQMIEKKKKAVRYGNTTFFKVPDLYVMASSYELDNSALTTEPSRAKFVTLKSTRFNL